jgi:hypothetical protein
VKYISKEDNMNELNLYDIYSNELNIKVKKRDINEIELLYNNNKIEINEEDEKVYTIHFIYKKPLIWFNKGEEIFKMELLLKEKEFYNLPEIKNEIRLKFIPQIKYRYFRDDELNDKYILLVLFYIMNIQISNDTGFCEAIQKNYQYTQYYLANYLNNNELFKKYWVIRIPDKRIWSPPQFEFNSITQYKYDIAKELHFERYDVDKLFNDKMKEWEERDQRLWETHSQYR